MLKVAALLVVMAALGFAVYGNAIILLLLAIRFGGPHFEAGVVVVALINLPLSIWAIAYVGVATWRRIRAGIR